MWKYDWNVVYVCTLKKQLDTYIDMFLFKLKMKKKKINNKNNSKLY